MKHHSKSRIPNQANWPRPDEQVAGKTNGTASTDQPCLLQADYQGFNLIGYRNEVFALAVSLGPVDLTRVTPKQIRAWERQGLYLDSSKLSAGHLARTDWVPKPTAAPADLNSPAQVSASDRSARPEEIQSEGQTPARLAPGQAETRESSLATDDQAAEIRQVLLTAISLGIEDASWVRNWNYLIEGFASTELLELADALGQDKQLEHQALEMLLIRLQTDRIQRQLDSSKKTVAIYFPTSAYREQFGTIPSRLRARGYNAITIVGAICGDKYEEQPDVFFGGHCGRTEIVNRLEFVDLFLTPVLVSGLPKDARKVYFLHDIHDSPLGDDAATRQIAKVLGEFDYIFAPSQASIELFRQVVPLAETPDKKPLGLIPGGYPKLDRLSAYFQAHRTEARTLIYAPTVFGYGFDEAASVLHHGEAIIEGVLNGIPDYRLIFRPHPHTLHTEVVRRLAAKFEAHPRFVFDDNASFYMDHYSQSALMISDISGTAFTYAFATERPVVFFSPNEEALRRQFAQLQYLADRERIGCVAQTVDELVEKVRLVLSNVTKYQAAVRTCRADNIFNVNRSEDYFVEHLELILSEQRHPDWTYLSREARSQPAAPAAALEVA